MNQEDSLMQIALSVTPVITSNTKVVETTSLLFKESNQAFEPMHHHFMKRPSSDRRRRSHSINSELSLGSIDEEKEFEKDDVSNRTVRIVSYIVAHDGEECSIFVASKLHDAITRHHGFNSMTNLPYVLRDAFLSVDTEYLDLQRKSLKRDESGCSVITTIISPSNDICIAYVGDVHASVRSADGIISDMLTGHVLSSAERERQRLKAQGIGINDDGKIFDRIIYSRAFGHFSLKEAHPDGIICLPSVIQVQMKFGSTHNQDAKCKPALLSSTSATASMSASGVISSTLYSNAKTLLPLKQDQSKENIIDFMSFIMGTSKSYQRISPKKLHSDISASLMKGDAIKGCVEKALNISLTSPPSTTKSVLFIRRPSFNDPQRTAGVCVLQWIRTQS